jgi:RND family efflux transporter MFP subunit
MTHGTALTKWIRWGGRIVVLLAFAAGVIILMLWLAGKFAPKVPAKPTTPPSQSSDVKGNVEPVRLVRLPRYESAVGTVRAVHETTIGSKLLARVMEVNLKAGQKVHTGDVLVRLDDTDLKAKLQQATAAVASIEAVRAQAVTDEKRYGQLVQSRAVSRQEYEKMVTALRSAEADSRRAQETVNEVQATLDWATIRSPIDGTIVDKKVDVGDMVTPGQMLVTLFDPSRMQLVASVRESLAYQLKEGQSIAVQVERLNKQCSGTISEIVPLAQSNSRTFQVKVTGPCPPGIYSGMFGRILIPLDEEEVLVIPSRAVQHVGQLQLVNVLEDGRVTRRSIRTGRKLGEDVEVLAGLREGEQVVVPTSAPTAREAAHG